MNQTIPFLCTRNNAPLILNDSEYSCPCGKRYPVLKGIPRFVPTESYASSFGLQWKKFAKTQLDSFTGTNLSRNRLIGLAGGSLDIFRGKNVLEAGCGAGRFTEIMLAAGANVYATDISTAVEANYLNCKHFPNYTVLQADIMALPFAPEQFDVVFCAGVIQHTADPEKTMSILCSHVKPGGVLMMDHYTFNYPTTPSRLAVRSVLLKMNKHLALVFCRLTVAFLWPLHRFFFAARTLRGVGRLRKTFLHLSPVVDYQGDHPQLGTRLLYQWAVLDTHDTLTDYYKHKRTVPEIFKHLASCGMTDIDAVYAGNGVEAMARKPLPGEVPAPTRWDPQLRPAWPHESLRGPFRHLEGRAWLATLQEYRNLADWNDNNYRSPLFLYEDGVGLGPGHWRHREIIQEGNGRYCHWGDGIIFSTSDGSDPNTNGRSYAIRLRLRQEG